MDQNDQTDTVAEEALSPSATDKGTPPSGVADQEESGLVEALKKDFDETYGDAEPADPEPDAEQSEELQTEEEAEPEAEAASGEDEGSAAAENADDDFRIPDEEFKGLPPNVKKRVGKLSTRLKRTTQELSTLKESMPDLEDRAGRFDKIREFTEQNNIEPQTVDIMFGAAALMAKGDYAGFLKAVQPYYDHASQAAGKAIAPDLQERVDNGYMTEEDAIAFTQARVQGDTHKAAADQARQREQRQRQEQQAQGNQQRMAQALEARTQQLQQEDPNFAQKLPAIKKLVESARNRGAQFSTAEDAISMLNEAYEAVSAAAPARQPVATPPRPTASNPPRGNAEPKSLQERLEQAWDAMSES